MGNVCSCGKGYRSRWDGACGKCRSRRDQRAHQYALSHCCHESYSAEDALRIYKYFRNKGRK